VAAMYSWQHCGTGTLSYRQPCHPVIMEQWNGQQSAFAIKLFYKNNDSVVGAQREFRPPRSPDFSVCDFLFLWGYLKNRVYTTRPRTLDELKQRIQDEIRGIAAEMLQRAMGGTSTTD